MRDAGLDVVDAWEERRVRRADPDAYMARIGAVASHLSASMDPDEAEAHNERVVRAVTRRRDRRASGPHSAVKLYGVARRPG